MSLRFLCFSLIERVRLSVLHMFLHIKQRNRDHSEDVRVLPPLLK